MRALLPTCISVSVPLGSSGIDGQMGRSTQDTGPLWHGLLTHIPLRYNNANRPCQVVRRAAPSGQARHDGKIAMPAWVDEHDSSCQPASPMEAEWRPMASMEVERSGGSCRSSAREVGAAGGSREEATAAAVCGGGQRA